MPALSMSDMPQVWLVSGPVPRHWRASQAPSPQEDGGPWIACPPAISWHPQTLLQHQSNATRKGRAVSVPNEPGHAPNAKVNMGAALGCPAPMHW